MISARLWVRQVQISILIKIPKRLVTGVGWLRYQIIEIRILWLTPMFCSLHFYLSRHIFYMIIQTHRKPNLTRKIVEEFELHNTISHIQKITWNFWKYSLCDSWNVRDGQVSKSRTPETSRHPPFQPCNRLRLTLPICQCEGLRQGRILFCCWNI